jgi:hypothetical protein
MLSSSALAEPGTDSSAVNALARMRALVSACSGGAHRREVQERRKEERCRNLRGGVANMRARERAPGPSSGDREAPHRGEKVCWRAARGAP